MPNINERIGCPRWKDEPRLIIVLPITLGEGYPNVIVGILLPGSDIFIITFQA